MIFCSILGMVHLQVSWNEYAELMILYWFLNIYCRKFKFLRHSHVGFTASVEDGLFESPHRRTRLSANPLAVSAGSFPFRQPMSRESRTLRFLFQSARTTSARLVVKRPPKIRDQATGTLFHRHPGQNGRGASINVVSRWLDTHDDHFARCTIASFRDSHFSGTRFKIRGSQL